MNGVAVDAGIDSGVPLALACVAGAGVDALRRGPPSEAASRVRDPDARATTRYRISSTKATPATPNPPSAAASSASAKPRVATLWCAPNARSNAERRDFFGVKDPAPRLNSTFSPGAFVSSRLHRRAGWRLRRHVETLGAGRDPGWVAAVPVALVRGGVVDQRSMSARVCGSRLTRARPARPNACRAGGSRERKSRDLSRRPSPPRIAAPSRNSETGGTICRWRPWSPPRCAINLLGTPRSSRSPLVGRDERRPTLTVAGICARDA